MNVLDLFRLQGRVSVVTGCHAWIGYDVAAALAEAGSDIVVTSRDPERAHRTAEKIAREFGVESLGVAMDQRYYDQVAGMGKRAVEWKGHIDILVNNAGGGSGKSEGNLFKRDPRDEADLIATNLTGVLYCCKVIAEYMVRQGNGKIVNIASIAGLVGRDRRIYERSQMKGQPVDYAAAKAGVIGLTRDLAAVLSPRGVCVNSISPGVFDKGELPPTFLAEYSDRTMSGRCGRFGSDIKGAALFLASGASDYVTGQNLVVDGGFSIWK
ncbi:MAG: SDR family oxidoreductase [Spirochaetes bacterium]|nr:SDR family oxidoreductase [Spirochaetota bacterium]